jgi:hypothetical protein
MARNFLASPHVGSRGVSSQMISIAHPKPETIRAISFFRFWIHVNRKMARHFLASPHVGDKVENFEIVWGRGDFMFLFINRNDGA